MGLEMETDQEALAALELELRASAAAVIPEVQSTAVEPHTDQGALEALAALKSELRSLTPAATPGVVQMGAETHANLATLAGLKSQELSHPASQQSAQQPEQRPEHEDPEFRLPEISAEENLAGISVLELAEVLDQHRNWVESGGESGQKADLSGVNLSKADLTGVNLQGAHMHRANLVGADLSMANLRGASLVQADMRETNLLGTELRGANLMGANLYGAEGVWVGRLGGTNLFDAILPETVAAFDSSKAIADATQVARWFYFLMLTASAICALLVAFTTDVRLVMNASAIPVSRLGNVLPMVGFYLGGPILLFAIYLRFHFVLLRLWGSMAALPATFQDGQTLEKDGPWYLMGMVRRHFRWTRDGRSSFAVLETVVSTALAYWVVPATLFVFWLRYLVLQDFRGTLLQAVLFTLSIAAATCVPTIVARVLRPGDLLRKDSKNLLRMIFGATRAALAGGLVLLLLSIGVIRGLPADSDAAPESSPVSLRRWAAQVFQSVGYRPYADLTETVLSPVPKTWNEEGLAAVQGAHLNSVDLRFARAYRAFLLNAKLWRGNLEGAYLSEADLRGANLREVILRDAILDRAQMGHATLVSVDARNANLAAADLRGADLSYANFENARLSNAKLPGASLYGVNLRNAQLLRTDLSRTDLRDAKLEQSILSFADLGEADLSSAKLIQANMTGAQMKGTILLDADLRNADLRSAFLGGAVLRAADITGANLAGADLRETSGITPTQICTAKWRGALLTQEMQSAVQSQCPGQ